MKGERGEQIRTSLNEIMSLDNDHQWQQNSGGERLILSSVIHVPTIPEATNPTLAQKETGDVS